ncbi:MAG: GNAT family N-acetyltransferase [Alphaproteobacteria bacterium]|nr:GNAT family N-acetyltransferase [Alphaproteobacteria bacterium]
MDAASDLLIRTATNGDEPVLERFAAALQEFERPLDASLMSGVEMIAAGYVTEMLVEAATRGGLVLIAEIVGVPVGYAAAVVKDEDDATVRPEVRHYLYVTDAYVEPEHRGSGIVQALLARMEIRARELGVNRMLINALAGNQAARAAYRRFGFRDYTVDMQKTLI